MDQKQDFPARALSALCAGTLSLLQLQVGGCTISKVNRSLGLTDGYHYFEVYHQ